MNLGVELCFKRWQIMHALGDLPRPHALLPLPLPLVPGDLCYDGRHIQTWPRLALKCKNICIFVLRVNMKDRWLTDLQKRAQYSLDPKLLVTRFLKYLYEMSINLAKTISNEINMRKKDQFMVCSKAM